MVNYVPILISGNTATIVPHNNKLAYNTAYYVTIDNGLLTGAISSAPFAGITATTDWTFTTKAAPPATLNVAADNSADFATVQGAIDSFAPGSTARTINIAPGVYQEMLFLRSKNNVTLKGSNNGLGTVIQYDSCDGFNPGTGGGQTVSTPGAGGTIPGYGAAAGNLAAGGRPILLTSSSSGLVLDSITIKNLHAQGSRTIATLPPSTVRRRRDLPAATVRQLRLGGHAGGDDVLQHQLHRRHQQPRRGGLRDGARHAGREAQQLHQLSGHAAAEGRELVLRLLRHRRHRLHLGRRQHRRSSSSARSSRATTPTAPRGPVARLSDRGHDGRCRRRSTSRSPGSCS